MGRSCSSSAAGFGGLRLAQLGRIGFFFGVSAGSSADSTLRFRRKLSNWMKNEDRLLPLMPMRATSARGRAVRQRMMIRTVREKCRERTGPPIATARMPASTTFRVLNIPPSRVPPSIKLGGIV